ncbi:MAG: kynureninase [Actinobacteria bacterium]|nr:kynureninase [Actinomycetota bacterium]
MTRAEAEALDRDDPLAPFRERFVIEGPVIYADGNSLGRLPQATIERLGSVVDTWGSRLVTAWPDWIDRPLEVGDLLADAVLGANAGEVLVCDSTTVNLFKLAAAALVHRPGALVTDADNFPTDRYVLEGLGELAVFDADPIDGPTADDVARACARRDVSVVCLSHVAYRSGALADVRAIVDVAHAAGALVLLDVSHSAGVAPVELEAEGVDLAVGCTYKYLNAGPGSPAFLYVREELQEELRSPIWGWFGQREQFAMGPAYDPVPGIGRFLAGTPPILGLAAVEVGAELVREAGIERLRRKSVALTELAISLHDERLAQLGFELGTPRDAERRSGHVSIRHADGWRICRALIERADVVPDFRTPDSIRLGLPPLYTRFVDAWDIVDRLALLVESGEHELVDAAPARVT